MAALREDASEILGVRVEKDHWNQAFALLDVSGRLSLKMVFQLLLIILKKLDESSEK